MSTVDFIIIGAQKAGTTSLFRYLSAHPNICMPVKKEIEFFSREEYYSKGLTWYGQWFLNCNRNNLVGEASPQYMFYDYVPERIFNVFPDVKLIVILRNPIDRAYSHYRMLKRRELENKNFSTLVLDLINRQKSLNGDEHFENHEYFAFGEYGRILSNYLQFFDKKNIHISFSENLNINPVATVNEICDFLNIEYFSDNKHIKKKYHKSGDKRFPAFERWIKNASWIKRLIKFFIPKQTLHGLIFWFETQANVKATYHEGPNKNDRELLKKYYKSDVDLVLSTFDKKAPWADFTNN